MDGMKLLCNENLCIPRKSISTTLELARDLKTSVNFKFAKKMSRLSNIHWRHKSRDVKSYVNECLKCQQ